jgi:hypothetical protein
MRVLSARFDSWVFIPVHSITVTGRDVHVQCDPVEVLESQINITVSYSSGSFDVGSSCVRSTAIGRLPTHTAQPPPLRRSHLSAKLNAVTRHLRAQPSLSAVTPGHAALISTVAREEIPFQPPRNLATCICLALARRPRPDSATGFTYRENGHR